MITKSQMEVVPHNRIWHNELEINKISKIVASGEWSGSIEVKKMENRFAEIAGIKYASATSSGISALRLALQSLRVEPGDRIALPAYSCVALTNAILATGGVPIPIDIDENTLNICALKLKKVDNLKAVIVVHTFGYPVDFSAIRELGIPIIEDCSHGFGQAEMGSLGDIICISLYATKLLAAGQGGIIMTNDTKKYQIIRDSSNYVDKQPSALRQRETMSSLEAGLAQCSLDRLKESIIRRKNIALKYNESLNYSCKNSERIWYRYVIRVDNSEDMIRNLYQNNIIAAKPIENWCKGNFPIANKAYKEIVSLPIYPNLTSEEQDHVIQKVLNFLN